jgi:DNA-binding transcriptional ArsR family regulator
MDVAARSPRQSPAADRDLDQAFFALSHRTRRRLLDQLSRAGETRVTDLARGHRQSLNTVSKHLTVLERSRLVRRRVSGRDHFIRLDLARLQQAERWLQYHREFWTTQLERLAQLFSAEETSSS